MASTTTVRPPSTTPKMKPPPAPTAPATNAPSSSGMSSSSPTVATKRPPSQTTKQRKDAQRQSTSHGPSALDGVPRGPKRRLEEPYVRTTEHILKKFAGKPPSLVLHLHPTHFRFDQQDGSFGYNSPMKIILEHVKSQTVPHEMMEELIRSGVTFYDGCLIVEIHDHKTGPAAARNTAQDNGKSKKFVPFSLHNYNEHVTPSPYVPYPTPSPDIKTEKMERGSSAMERSRSSQQGKDAGKQKTVFTTVLHPTQLSQYKEIGFLATTPAPDRGRKGSALAVRDGTNSPSTPLTPVTTNRQPPGKRQKMMLEEKDIHAFEAGLLQFSGAPLCLEPAHNFEEAQAIMKALTHPLHNYAPVKQQGRKRTTAELAADEAQAAEEERIALIMDERLKPSLANNAAGAGGTSDGTGSIEFVPNFSRFKTLEDIKRTHEEEATRKREQEQRQRLETRARQEHEAAEKQQKETAARLAAQQQETTSKQLLQRQAVAQAMAAQQGQTGRMNQMQQQFAQHMQAQHMQAQLLQQNQQQGQQPQNQMGQHGSPMLRAPTPAQATPALPNMVNGQANMPMQMMPSASSQGHANSPARPPSAIQQGVPMMKQMSQQTQINGTPQMPQATPLMANGQPRHITPQPRATQASPPPGSIQGTPMINNMTGTPQMNGQQMSQQQALLMQQRRAQMNVQAQAHPQGQMQGSPHQMQNQMSPQQQQALMQAQQQMTSPHVNMQGQNGQMQNMQAQSMNPQQQQNMQRAAMEQQYRKSLQMQQASAQANLMHIQGGQNPQQQRPPQQMNAAMFNPNVAAMAQNMVRNPSQAQAAMMQQQNSQMMNGQMQPNQMLNVNQAQHQLLQRQNFERERQQFMQNLMQRNGGQMPADAVQQFETWRKSRMQRMQLARAQQQQQLNQRAMQQMANGNAGGNPMLTPGGTNMMQMNGMNNMQMGNVQAMANGQQLNPQQFAQIQMRRQQIAAQIRNQQQMQQQQGMVQQMRQGMNGMNGMNGQQG